MTGGVKSLVYEIIMPKLAETMEEGTIVQWLKSEGEWVEKGEPLFVVEMVKTTMEVPSPSSGYMRRILFGEGHTIEVTEPIAYMADNMDEAIPEVVSETPDCSGREESEAPGQRHDPGSSARTEERVKASPIARKLAEEYGVCLHSLQGSGPGGRIVEADVRRAIEDRPQVMKMTRIREIIAKRMSESKRTIPHFYVTMEVHMSPAVEWRSELSSSAKISYNDLVIKAVANALRKFPLLNSKCLSDGIVLQDAIGIGVAVNTEAGLLVPVVKNADTKSILEISLESARLIEKAREGSLVPDELSGGTFTVTNMGMLGADSFAAIINPPEVGILAVGMIAPKAVIRNDSIVERHMMNLTLSVDHRVIDGALAAQFLSAVKLDLENPQRLA